MWYNYIEVKGMNSNVKLKQVITNFEHYSRNLLNTTHEQSKSDLYRFKKFIDETEEIFQIIKPILKKSKIDYTEVFIVSGGPMKYVLPLDEDDHIKAIYDYITMIVDTNFDIFNIAALYPFPEKNADEIIRRFFNEIIFPLINFISNKLSLMLMELDDIYPSMTLNATNSPVYFHSAGNQYVSYQNNTELSEINALIEKIINIFNTEESCKDPDLIDDIQLMKETINCPEPNEHRIKKVIKNINEGIKNINATTTQALILKESIESLIQLVKNVFGG